MNRKEMACAAVGALVGASGCSSAVRSLAVPVASAGETAPTIAKTAAMPNAPHVTEVHLSLVSGTPKDIGSAVFRLSPDTGWAIASDDPRLDVSVERGHVATMTAPENEKVHFIGTATISHPDGTTFLVRCHVSADC
jgi:hypothetical protein